MFDSTPGPKQDAKKIKHKFHTFLVKKSVENVIQNTPLRRLLFETHVTI